MKKAILILSLSVVLLLTGLTMAFAQEVPQPQKDTVNIDTDAKPTFYYAVEDEESAEEAKGKSSTGLMAIIAGAVIVVGGVVLFLLRKKK